MPWKSHAQRAKMSKVFSPEQVAEWDAATNFDKLPERVAKAPAKEYRGRKSTGLAKLGKLSGLRRLGWPRSNA